MKTIRYLPYWLISGFVFFFFLFAIPQAAQADTWSTLVKIMDAVHKAVPDCPSGEQLDASRKLIECLASSDMSSPDCFALYGGAFGDNPYLDTIIKLYAAVNGDSFWTVVGVVVQWLGDDAPCIIASIMIPGGGGTLCALVKELIELAVQVCEAIAQFFEDLGAALWEGLKDAYCATLGFIFGGCDEDDTPPPPAPEQVIYEQYFVPKLKEGLAKRKQYNWISGDLIFQTYFQYITSNDQVYSFASGMVGKGLGYDYNAVQAAIYQAGQFYRQQLNANWTTEVVQTDASALGNKRGGFDSLKGIQGIEADMMARIAGCGSNCLPLEQYFASACLYNFQDFAHVDYWIASFPQDAAKLQLLDNKTWCTNLALKYKDQLTAYVQNYLSNFCPSSGSDFKCNSTTDYMKCNTIAATLPTHQQCSIDTAKVGLELAHKIDDAFKAEGSQIPCRWPTIMVSAKPVDFTCSRPTQVANCQNKCKTFVAQMGFQNGTQCSQFLNCVGPQETPEYVALKNRVKYVADVLKNGVLCQALPDQRTACVTMKTNTGTAQASSQAIAAVADREKLKVPSAGQKGTMTAQAPDQGKTNVPSAGQKGVPMVINPHPSTSTSPPCGNMQIDTLDPLIIKADQCFVDKAKKSTDQNFGFHSPSKKSGFDYDASKVNPVDGASTPVLLVLATGGGGGGHSGPPINAGGSAAQQPLTTVSSESQLKETLAAGGTAASITTQQVLNNTSNPDNPADTGVGTGNQNVTLKKGNLIGPTQGGTEDTGGTGNVSPVTSGNMIMTEGSNLQGQTQTQTTNATETTNAGTPMSVTIAPDLTCIVGPKIAGQSAAWGGTITVEGKEAVSKNNGICEFQFEYTVRNTGNGPLAGTAGNKTFRMLLTNNAMGGNWTHVFALMAPKSAQSDTVRIPLKPGKNVLQLVIDDQHQVQESNENNNTFKVTVIVKGKCEKLK